MFFFVNVVKLANMSNYDVLNHIFYAFGAACGFRTSQSSFAVVWCAVLLSTLRPRINAKPRSRGNDDAAKASFRLTHARVKGKLLVAHNYKTMIILHTVFDHIDISWLKNLKIVNCSW